MTSEDDAMKMVEQSPAGMAGLRPSGGEYLGFVPTRV